MDRAGFVMFLLLGLFTTLIVAGCGNSEFLADVDRNYAATYDADSGRAGGVVTWTPAREPGRGRPSVSVRVEGQVSHKGQGTQREEEIDFKKVVPPMDFTEGAGR